MFLLAGRGGEGEEVVDSERKAWPGRSGEFRTFPFLQIFPRFSNHLYPPSPTRGRSVVLECGSLDIDGASEESCGEDFRSFEATSAGITLTAVCRTSKPMSSGVFSTSIGGLLSGQRPRSTSALKQVVPSPRRCSAAVQMTFGSSVEIGWDLIASQHLSEGSSPHKMGTYVLCYFSYEASVILYTSTVCVLI
jgi:hypothetical protein